jgi:hypothetical protein
LRVSKVTASPSRSTRGAPSRVMSSAINATITGAETTS